MRYYKIIITDPDGKLMQFGSSVPGSGATYTSFANNRTIAAALQVELDIPLAPYATPMGSAIVRVWGITLKEISAATKLNPTVVGGAQRAFGISVYGGMKKGLPLANPKQADLLVQGSIQQAFGNWIGTDMTLDLIIAPQFGTNTLPKNLSFDWKAGTPLKQAIANTLSIAFPGVKQNINISADLVVNHDEPGYYNTLEQFASWLQRVSVSIVGKDSYPGVNVFLNNGVFEVDDATTAKTPKSIAFQDLIGQPTWIGDPGPSIQLKCVMRGDISIGDYIRMPPAIVTTQGSSSTALTNLKSAFEGSFYVSQIRHVGNFRQPDAASWVTTINAAPTVVQSNSPGPANTAHSR